MYLSKKSALNATLLDGKYKTAPSKTLYRGLTVQHDITKIRVDTGQAKGCIDFQQN